MSSTIISTEVLKKYKFSVAPRFTLVNSAGVAITGSERGLLLYNGGTVCDDGFEELEAGAVCKELGHGEAVRWEPAYQYPEYQSSLQITLDNVVCTESSWDTCTFQETHNCKHAEDVFLTCSGMESTGGK